MIRASSILSRTLAATRVDSAASFAIPNRFLQGAHYGSCTARGSRHTMFRVSPILSRTLSATRVGSAASFAVHNRYPQAVHYSSSIPHPIGRLLQWYEFHRKPLPVLYQFHVVPPGKLVQVFMDYHNIPYKVVEIGPLTMRKVDLFRGGKLPILIVDGEQLDGTSAIIDRLRQKFPLKEKTNSTSADFEDIEWRHWAEGSLNFVLHINMFQTASEALESADYMLSEQDFVVKFGLKYFGAAAGYFWFRYATQKFNISDKRAALYEAAETWVDALYGREFRGGSKPNLADMAVFGILRPVRYMKCCKDMVEHTRIGEWYTRMENAVGKSSRIKFWTGLF